MWTSDGGGRAIAARKPIRGARARRARLGRHAPQAAFAPAATPVELNGRLGLLIPGTDGHAPPLSFVVDGGRIARIDVVRNPEKLRRALSPGADADARRSPRHPGP